MYHCPGNKTLIMKHKVGNAAKALWRQSGGRVAAETGGMAAVAAWRQSGGSGWRQKVRWRQSGGRKTPLAAEWRQ